MWAAPSALPSFRLSAVFPAVFDEEVRELEDWAANVTALELQAGLEPVPLGLGSRCSTD